MTLISTIKAAAAAAALSVGILAALPAMAAPPPPPPPPPPHFGFQMQFGNNFGGPGMYFNYGGKPKTMCLSDRQISWQLDRAGWDHVRIVNSRGWKVIAVASWHHRWYQLLIDRCSGRITQKPVAFRGNSNNWNGPISNFGITLNF